MTMLTKRARQRTFPLDQLLDMRTRRVRLCLCCAGETAEGELPIGSVMCPGCGSFTLCDPESVIIANMIGGSS